MTIWLNFTMSSNFQTDMHRENCLLFIVASVLLSCFFDQPERGNHPDFQGLEGFGRVTKST